MAVALGGQEEKGCLARGTSSKYFCITLCPLSLQSTCTPHQNRSLLWTGCFSRTDLDLVSCSRLTAHT